MPTDEQFQRAADEAREHFLAVARRVPPDHTLLSAYLPVPQAWATDPVLCRELGDVAAQAAVSAVAAWATERGHYPADANAEAQPVHLDEPGTELGRVLAAMNAISAYADRAMAGTAHGLSMSMVPVPNDLAPGEEANALLALFWQQQAAVVPAYVRPDVMRCQCFVATRHGGVCAEAADGAPDMLCPRCRNTDHGRHGTMPYGG